MTTKGDTLLTLTRRADQSIVIGKLDNPLAVIVVVSVNKRTGAVQLGVKADKGIPVDRMEIAVSKSIASKGQANV